MGITNVLQGQTAVVTGAASGIGKASAIALAGQGAKVSLIDIHETRLRETEREIKEAGGEALSFTADISKPEEIGSAIRSTAKQWGSIDIVLANAGILGMVSPIEHFPTAEWAGTMTNNLVGTFETVKQSIPYMKEKGGSMILVSSVSGNRSTAQKGFSAYSTSKAGIATFAEMAALELAQYNIRVNAVCPGYVETNIFESQKKSEHLDEIHFPFEFPQPKQGGFIG